jgi:hypothetical protein
MTPSHGAPFRGFRDHEESPFFRAPGLTPEETWNLSVDRLGGVLGTLGALAAAGPIEMTPTLLCSWHHTIFGELFPEDLQFHDDLLGPIEDRPAFVGKHDPYRPLAEHIAEIISDSEST